MADNRWVLSIKVESWVSVVVEICGWGMEWSPDLEMEFVKLRS